MNKRTAALMALADEGESPCAFALRVMRDENQDVDVRIQAARIAAPLLHAKPQPQPRHVTFVLPESIEGGGGLLSVHAGVLRAVADGGLSLEEARELSAILETHRRMIETETLENRIAELERKQA